MVEEGAGLVVCQHSHRPGCLETHQNGYIVYGQGNLVFDRHPHSHEFWYEGFLVELGIDGVSNSSVRLIPYRQYDSTASVRKLAPEPAAAFQAEIEQRSENIRRAGFLERQWLSYCEGQADEYLGYICGYGPLLGRLNSRLHIARRFCRSRRMLLRKSVIQCESHRDALETILDNGVLTA
jgi:poly-gamma-glutamate synthesis protein (capsule biosynthesis protein)